MYNFGHTRAARHHDHTLQTPDTFVRAPMPGMKEATAIVHASPALGAKFTEYTAEFEAGGTLAPTSDQRFVYVLAGSLTAGNIKLASHGYAWLPPAADLYIQAETAARALIIEKPWQPREGAACPNTPLHGNERELAAMPLLGDEALQVRSLIPADSAYDLAVNTLTFHPGATLPMVEMHVMEHGLMMLEGAGVYRMGERWYPVFAGDFIWMAPWLPQWFGALGKVPAKYILYKDWNR